MEKKWQCPKCLEKHITFAEAERCNREHKDKTIQEIRGNKCQSMK